MNRWVDTARAAVALLALAGVAAAGVASAYAPTAVWRDVRRVTVHCNVQDERAGYDAMLTRGLCAKVRALAAVGSPVPLRVADFGDPALTAADNVTLIVQGSAVGSYDAKSLMFTIRAHRTSVDHPAEMFGSALQAVPVTAIDPAIKQALAEVLPWQAQYLDARPIR